MVSVGVSKFAQTKRRIIIHVNQVRNFSDLYFFLLRTSLFAGLSVWCRLLSQLVQPYTRHTLKLNMLT